MLKIDYADKIFLICVFMTFTFLMFYYNLNSITGYNSLDVGIKEKTQGEIRIGYNFNVNLTETQNITAEFVNTGTSNYTSRIEITVYFYNDTSRNLQELANYYDGNVVLFPGEIRSFKTIFLPSRIGVYYIKVRVPYDSKIAESWGSFSVTYYYAQTQPIIHVITYYGGGTIPGQREYGVTDLDLKYKNKVDLYPGQRVLIDIGLNNTGTINLHNLRFYSTTTEDINFEVNPKEIYELGFGESNLFLVSLNVSEYASPGEYDFFFEVQGLEVSRTGNIKLNVTLLARPIKDEVYDAILNYEYLITEIEHEIYLTSLKGFNTSRAEGYLDNAKGNLQKARDYFGEGRYEDARDVLDLVKRDLENVVFELAVISFGVFEYPAFSPFLILLLLIIILISALIFIYLYKKRKENRKPKLFKELTEEET